ncbi:hypothetical protein AB4144_07815 [Rhizobiaceae sp. 2RAB30]
MIWAVIRLESGAKSPLDPHEEAPITPHVADDIAGVDLIVSKVTRIEACRTFWERW